MRTDPPPASFLGAPRRDRPDQARRRRGHPRHPARLAVSAPGAAAGCAEAPAAVRRRSQRMARFVDHWDFDLDGPMRLRRAWSMPATSPATRPTDLAIRGRPSPRWPPSSIAARCRSASAATTRSPSRSCAPSRVAEPITVLQVDAHLDFRDEVDGVREGYSSPMRRASEMATWSGSSRSGCAASARRARQTSTTPAPPGTCWSPRASSASAASAGCSSSCLRRHRSSSASTVMGLTRLSCRPSPRRLPGARLPRGVGPACRRRHEAGGRRVHRICARARQQPPVGTGRDPADVGASRRSDQGVTTSVAWKIGPIWQMDAMSVDTLPRTVTSSAPRATTSPEGDVSCSGLSVRSQPDG